MRGFAAVVGNQVNGSEKEVHYKPRVSNGRGVIYCHGNNGSHIEPQRFASGSYRLFQRLAHAGYHVLTPDLGGPYTWGNDTAVDRITSARQILINNGCSDRIVLIGGSMGNTNVLRYMADFPSRVACGIGLIPAIDIDQIRANNWNGLKANIESAWGIGSSDPIPARGIPLNRTAEMSPVPWAGWYGSADTVVDGADCIALANALGGDSMAIEANNTYDHSDALMRSINVDDIIAWIDAHQ